MSARVFELIYRSVRNENPTVAERVEQLEQLYASGAGVDPLVAVPSDRPFHLSTGDRSCSSIDGNHGRTPRRSSPMQSCPSMCRPAGSIRRTSSPAASGGHRARRSGRARSLSPDTTQPARLQRSAVDLDLALVQAAIGSPQQSRTSERRPRSPRRSGRRGSATTSSITCLLIGKSLPVASSSIEHRPMRLRQRRAPSRRGASRSNAITSSPRASRAPEERGVVYRRRHPIARVLVVDEST